MYGEGFDTGPHQVGAGSLSFCRFSRLLVVVLGFTAGFSTPLALFWGLCSCGGAFVDRNLSAQQSATAKEAQVAWPKGAYQRAGPG